MFNPAKAAEEIKKEYIGYISTSYHFRDQKIQNKMEKELNGLVSNGPFLEVKDIFENGRSIRELMSCGVLSPLFTELAQGNDGKSKLHLDRQLYKHQDEAIVKIVSGENVVVSTGTGSGKTYCFLIPVLNELLREQENGTLDDGVRAIFIYPMNALANDQIKGLREILSFYKDIKFGVYNGGTEEKEEDAIRLYEATFAKDGLGRLSNERLSREEMKDKPPHILFTNYAMLEHLLLRPKDDVLFSKSQLKYIVLDEAHVYSGAVGIETALLIGRLKARLGDSRPQFILTSATLGDQSEESKKKVAEFATALTGCEFKTTSIVYSYRKTFFPSATCDYRQGLFTEIMLGEKGLREILRDYAITFNVNAIEDNEILYDLIANSHYYSEMRKLGNLIRFDDFIYRLGVSRQEAEAFVAACAKAKKNGSHLVDIRYHYFLRALDGGYMALDYLESFSLVRKEKFENKAKMFEVGVCDDCGEISIIGKQYSGKLFRAGVNEAREFYQIVSDDETDEFDPDEDIGTGNKKCGEIFVLCKNCGAIVADNQKHNAWCKCGNTAPVRLQKLSNDKCLNCNGNIKRLQLGYDAATAVIATSLFEQIPETETYIEDKTDETKKRGGLFVSAIKSKKHTVKTGSRFLVFSDSRQGAAKFACYMSEHYKEFMRRRSIWYVAEHEKEKYSQGLTISEFVSLLENYYSSNRLFRSSNADDATYNIIDDRRNAWIAVLNELYNSSRDTSLVSLGKIKFEYAGNSEEIINVVVNKYNVDYDSAKDFLNYLAMDIVRNGAVVTDKETDINNEDRKYIFYTPVQQVVTEEKNDSLKNSKPYLPTRYTKKNGEKKYYRQLKTEVVKRFLGVDDEEAVEFLKEYWDWLVNDENRYCLQAIGKGYAMRASSIKVYFGDNAKLWKCEKCQKVTQYNINGTCIKSHCDGRLSELDSDAFCRNNYYAAIYDSEKKTPLFIKEHTAQLAKEEALKYQQMFVNKEINALSCSTTFEMGVDVGELETVFLRNFPPLPSNYAQRVGRAGRSINAAAFAVTYARLSSHDFTFFDRPEEMINGVIYPPQFKLENEKIIRRHIYAVAIGLFLKNNENQYNHNNAGKFINEKGYELFLNWINSKPDELRELLKRSIPPRLWDMTGIELNSFGWLEGFCGEHGRFTSLIKEYEKNVEYLEKEYRKSTKAANANDITLFDRKLRRYKNNELIDFLVRGNILPKYGFPVDSVELAQNIAAKDTKTLNLNRDLSVAISEYAPSSEVVADGGLYTSRYIKKPIVNKKELSDFDFSYIAVCPKCKCINYSNMPTGSNGQPCVGCGQIIKSINFVKSIEPRSGFIAEENVKPVPLTAQERKYKTEAIYIGDKEAYPINTYTYILDNVKVNVQSTANDSLVVRSTDSFYVCPICGYSIADDEKSKLTEYKDYKTYAMTIKNGPTHKNPYGKGSCQNTELHGYGLHHEFKTDVAKIEFDTDTSDYPTMLSVMYAMLNAFADLLSIEKRDVKACLTYKQNNNERSHQIIIYDSVPGGAGHSRRLVTENGEIFKQVIERAKRILSGCDCDPSCYKCLRNYENQKFHEILDRNKALIFFDKL